MQKEWSPKMKISLIILSILLLFALLLGLFLFLSEEDPLPYEKNTHWQSTEPNLSLKASVHISNLREWTYTGNDCLEWEGNAMAVYMEFSTGKFSVFLDGEKENENIDLLFRGDWEYDNNDNLVLHIEEDKLMGDTYKTITLQPVGERIENSNKPIPFYPYKINSSWLSLKPFFDIHQQNNEGNWQALGDLLIWDGEAFGVTTVMTGDKYYVVSSTTVEKKGYPRVLFSGTWKYNIQGNLILFVENDNLMEGKYEVITLNPIGVWIEG